MTGTYTRTNNNLILVPRTQKNTSKAEQDLSKFNPLIIFLNESADDVDSRLWRIAQTCSQQLFDVDRFRADLLAKLKRVPYSEPRDPKDKEALETFYDRLQAHRALSILLRTSTLRDIWRWLLLRETIKTDRELEYRKESAERCPVRFHTSLMTELLRHQRLVRTAIKKYNVDEHQMDTYLTMVNRQCVEHLRVYFLSRFPGSRKSLLGNGLKEALTAQTAVVRLLKLRYHRNPFSERFLRRLAQIICAPSDIREISSDCDDALRKSLERAR